MAYTPTQGLWKKMKYLTENNFSIYLFRPKTGSYYGKEQKFHEYIKNNFIEYKIWSLSPSDLRYILFRNDEVVLSKSWDSFSKKFLSYFLFIIKNILYFPDSNAYFFIFSLFKCFQKKLRFDFVYARIPAPSMAIAGFIISKLFHKPLILDYYDHWHGSKDQSNKPLLIRKLEIVLEKTILNYSSLVITCTKTHKHFLSQKFGSPLAKKIFYINNAVDKDDFIPSNLNIKEPKKFTITFLGGLSNSSYPEDCVITPKYFLKAVRQALNSNGLSSDDLLIKFIGYFGPNNVKYITDNKLFPFIEISNYQSHEKCLMQMQMSDILLLILFEHSEATRRVNYKLYEYLWSKKPILALVPDGEIESIVNKYNAGKICPPKDVEQIAHSLSVLYQEYLNNEFCKYGASQEDLGWCEKDETNLRLMSLINMIGYKVNSLGYPKDIN
jgi:hypothetical protein